MNKLSKNLGLLRNEGAFNSISYEEGRKTRDVKNLVDKSLSKSQNIRNIEKVKEDNRRNTELSIKKMIDTEIYYALASRQMRRSVQQMASSLLKVHKLKGRMWYVCEIAKKLVDEKVISLDEVLERKGIEWEAPTITIRQRKNDQVGGPTHTWVEVSKHIPHYGICTLVIPRSMPIQISKNGSRGLSYDEIKQMLDFTLVEFEKFETEFIKRIQKWLSK